MPKLMKSFLALEHALEYCHRLRNIRPALYIEAGLDGQYHVYDPDA